MDVMLWRVVITDSEHEDGVAPVCPKQLEPGGPHHRDTTDPDRAWFDTAGVYDCCPKPHLRANHVSAAAELADLMSAYDVQEVQ